MKKVITILVIVFLVVGVLLLVGVSICKKSNQNCNDLDDLSTIVGIDLNKYNIDEIKSEVIKDEDMSTEVLVKVIADNDEKIYQEFEESNQAPPGLIDALNELGVNAQSLSRFGVKHKELSVRKLIPFLETEYRPYEVWLLSEEQSNVIFIYTCVPDKIKVNID